MISEGFDAGLTAGWTTVHAGTSTSGADEWTWCDGAASCKTTFGFTGASGGFMYSDSGAEYYDEQDEQLLSPALDLSGATEAVLVFDTKFDQSYYASEEALVQVTTDAGSSWTTVYSGKNGVATNVIVDIAPCAGQPAVGLRFRYLAFGDYFWSVDNVVVRKR